MVSSAQQRFNDLPLDRQETHFTDVARRALPLWGLDPDACRLTLLNLTENATFRVDIGKDEATDAAPAAMRRRIVMRVHRLDYAERDSIEVELAWIRELRRSTDLRLAEPLPGFDGDCVQSVDCPDIEASRNVVCFSFVTGTAPRDSTDDTEGLSKVMDRLARIPDSLTVPATRVAAMVYDKGGTHGALNIAPSRVIDAITSTGGPSVASMPTEAEGFTLPAADRRLYRAIGIIAAKLRRNSVAWTPMHRADLAKRISWDWEATFGRDWNNYYGCHYWDVDSTLTRHDIEAIDRCRDLMKRRLDAYGTSPARYGLIHSDLRPANLLRGADGRLAVLDFDDCGMGWYMTDIAGIVGFMEHRPDLTAVLDAVLEGYTSVWPLDRQEIREIPTFVMIRRIGLFEALLYHRDNADPGTNENAVITPELVAFFGKGTAMLARKYVQYYRRLALPTPPEEPSTGGSVGGLAGGPPGESATRAGKGLDDGDAADGSGGSDGTRDVTVSAAPDDDFGDETAGSEGRLSIPVDPGARLPGRPQRP